MSVSGTVSDAAHIIAGFDLPSVDQFLAGLSGPSSSLSARDHKKVDLTEQQEMFHALKVVVEHVDGTGEAASSHDLKELYASLEQADAEARHGRRDVDALRKVRTILEHLWACNSGYLAQAAEILANCSRDSKCFIGILGQLSF